MINFCIAFDQHQVSESEAKKFFKSTGASLVDTQHILRTKKYVKHKKKYHFPVLLAMLIYLSACQQPGGNVTGSEYMPDMSHSIAYEANYYNYYVNNTWGSQDEYYNFAKPRLPVKGTVARGYTGDKNADYVSSDVGFAPSGSVPYYFEDTEEERTRAGLELIDNPYEITEEGLQVGKELYDVLLWHFVTETKEADWAIWSGMQMLQLVTKEENTPCNRRICFWMNL